MSGQRETLQQAIEDLRQKIDASIDLAPAVAERLRRDLDDAAQALSGPAGGREPGLRQRLGEAVIDFEATHPTLATALGNVIDAMGRLGI